MFMKASHWTLSCSAACSSHFHILFLKYKFSDKKLYVHLGMSIDMKRNIDIRGGHTDTELFYWFRKFLIVPAPN
jgi:hypothetical protein